jgi:bacillithiol biosynthesis cysteine-adding enzyme BshC
MLPHVLSEEIGGSALALAAQRGELPQWYVRRPLGPNEWSSYLAKVAAGHRRDDWLDRLAGALSAAGAAKARLQRVADSGGVIVSTGQQAALFGGPLYTLVKAIGALGMADAIEQTTGIAAAPVFWAATDDADYEEARSVTIAIPGGTRSLRLSDAERSGIPMSMMPMPGVERLVEELAEACGSVPDPAALEIVRACYTSSETLGNAYVRQLRGLLEPLGVAVLDASHPAVRQSGERVLRTALEKADEVERALRGRYESIRAGGYTPQVEHVPGLSLVFATAATGDKQRVPTRDAKELRSGQPTETLSANVLLRPLVERSIMPSAAYLAGPGELAYFAQVSVVAEVLEVPTPLALPRWSATILEPRVERILSRLGLARDELRDRSAVETRLARVALPDELSDSLARLRRNIEADIAALEVADRDNIVPSASLQGLRRALLHRLERAERRYVAGVKRRETELMRDIGTAAGALYPEGMRQERVLNFVPFIARYGMPLLAEMREQAIHYANGLIGAAVPSPSAPVAERV